MTDRRRPTDQPTDGHECILESSKNGTAQLKIND